MTLIRIEPDAVPEAAEHALLRGAAWAPTKVAVIEFKGPSVADCLQGLLTSDVVAPGPNGFVYGALLTTKGMIVCDLWVARDGTDAWVFTPPDGRDAALDIFTRFVPPRLAEHQLAPRQTVLRLVGPSTLERAASAGIPVPKPGAAIRGEIARVTYRVARPRVRHAFELQIRCEKEDVDVVTAALEGAGVEPVPTSTLEVARVLAGVPRLLAETDEKTLPQEVRFEELDGVSFSKGCYTGQETVARVHFRGHVNRRLAGLVWDDAPATGDTSVTRDGKTVGRVTSMVPLRDPSCWIGLGMLKREVEADDVVEAAGQAARVRSLPHHPTA